MPTGSDFTWKYKTLEMEGESAPVKKNEVQPHIDHRYMLTFIPRHLNSAESTLKKKKILPVCNFSFSFLTYLEGGREEVKKA